MMSHPSRRGSNFCRFLASDIEKITIFWESTLCEIIAFLRTRQSLCKTKFQKKILFWGIFPKTCFLFADTYSDHGVSPIAEGVEFLPFFGLGRRKNNDILGIYFVRNNCVFSDALELVQNKIPKKVTFLGNFPGCIFYHVSFSWLCFYTVHFRWSTTSGWA